MEIQEYKQVLREGKPGRALGRRTDFSHERKILGNEADLQKRECLRKRREQSRTSLAT